MAPLIGYDHRESELCGECDIPIPAMPALGHFDLGLSHPTYYQSVNIFSPAGRRRRGVDPLFASLASSNTLTALDLQALFDRIAQQRAARRSAARRARRAAVRAGAPRCRTRSASRTRPTAPTAANQVRVVTGLDDSLSRAASASATSRSAASRQRARRPRRLAGRCRPGTGAVGRQVDVDAADPDVAEAEAARGQAVVEARDDAHLVRRRGAVDGFVKRTVYGSAAFAGTYCCRRCRWGR